MLTVVNHGCSERYEEPPRNSGLDGAGVQSASFMLIAVLEETTHSTGEKKNQYDFKKSIMTVLSLKVIPSSY